MHDLSPLLTNHTIDDSHLHSLKIEYENQQTQPRKHATSTIHAQKPVIEYSQPYNLGHVDIQY